MAKKAKAREAELRYLEWARALRKAREKDQSRTPWKKFFSLGAGAKVKTPLSRPSIYAIVHSYGNRAGKRYVCSYEWKGKQTVVTLKAVKRRKA